MQINNAPLGDHCQAPLWFFIMDALITWYMVMSENQRDPQYKLRWPEELRDKVAASAKAYNRSMNADIIARLERSFLTEPDFSPLNMPPEELAKRLKAISDEKLKNKSEKIIISREYYDELLEIKSALKNLSLAVLNLEKHSLDQVENLEDEKKAP